MSTGHPSARKDELLEAAYRYALTHGLSDLSLRPLARAIGSSPRVLLYLFESKDGLLKALLARAREDELAMLAELRGATGQADIRDAVLRIWSWLCDPAHRELLVLWLESYSRSLADPDGPWAGFAAQTVSDWLTVLKQFQPAAEKNSRAGTARRSAALALLRGALLDLLATGEGARITAALSSQVESL